MIKLSVIIPIYKVENYIVECLESICCQFVEGVEVILVNDGTPDRSMIIAKEYINENYSQYLNQFVFIDQENQGQSVARNVALKKATGEYISFIDSDDVLSKEYFNKLVPLLSEVDIIQFKSARFLDNTSEMVSFNVGLAKQQGVYETSRDLMIDIFNQSAWFPWLNVYKRVLFDSLEFPIGVYFEDAVLIPEVFLRAKNIYFLNDVLYFYRINNEGSLLNVSNTNIEKKIRSYEFALNHYIQKLSDQKIYSPSFVSMLQGYISFVYQNLGFSRAKATYNQILKNKKLVSVDIVHKRGNKLFFRFGIYFIVFLRLLGKS